mgnify:CR=1 FL=1
MSYLVTGSAGFIGFHVCNYLCQVYKKSKIIGIDNINNFYSPKLKKKDFNNLENLKIFNLIK